MGHNIADSLASGIDLMIGTCEKYVFAEASTASLANGRARTRQFMIAERRGVDALPQRYDQPELG